jgi:tetratricopeptide (TPR) repeat protein
LTYWVRRNIRYVSSGEKHDYTPHAPALVLANRYGDCKDTSQLLAVMLREAGVPVALVTIGAQDDGQILPELPSPWGTHAMLLVTLDGKEHWIDTTVSLAAWDYLPRDDRGRVAYVIDDKGLRLTRTPVLRPEGNRIVQTTNVTIGSDGSVRMERDIIAYGSAALARREEWVEVPAGERRRLMTVELQDANSRARLRELLINEKTLHDFDQPASARVVFEIPGHFSGEPEREGSLTDSAIWARILSYHLDPDRKMPLELGAPFESVHRYRVQLPPAFRLDHVPSNRQVRSPWGFFRLTVTADEDRPRQLELVFHTRLDKVLVSPSQFDAWRRFHDDLLKQYRVWLTLRPTTDLADAPALEALLAVAPGDSDSAATLVQLYLRHGKYEPARRVLRRARVYHPNDPALAELTVKTALGLKEEEEAYRELVRLFPDEPRYAVSLGQVLVDRDNGEGARSVLQPVADNAAPTWSSQAHHQLARLCFKEGKPVAALEHLEAARKASADTANTVSVWLLQGRVCERLERPRAAAEAYRQALQLDPNSAETLAALVQLSMASKATGQALDYLRRYTVVVGDDGEGLAQAAEFHRRLGRAEDALELANRARQHGEEILANRVLGLVYLQRGDHVRALACLEQTERDGPVLAGLIRCQLALGRLRAAERLVESAEQIKQPTPELARACALTLSLGQRRAALSREIEVPEEKAEIWERALDRVICAEEALERGRPVAQVEALVGAAFADGVAIGLAFALRGQLALERGRLRRALEDGDRAIKLSPKEPRGYLVRGRARLERGENGAVADLTRAAELSGGKDATVLHWLAAAMYRDGALNEALRTQREAVKLRPRDAELAEQLKELEKAVKTVVPERSPGK